MNLQLHIADSCDCREYGHRVHGATFNIVAQSLQWTYVEEDIRECAKLCIACSCT